MVWWGQIFEDGEQPNVFAKKRDIKDEYNNAFDTLQDGEINICFTNTLDDGKEKDHGLDHAVFSSLYLYS